jgi:hypothetical protein
MTDHPHRPVSDETRRRGHELDRVSTRAVITIGLIIGGVVLGSLAFLGSLHGYLSRQGEARQAAPAAPRRSWDRPPVDFDQPSQLRALREWERETLAGYGWQNEEKTAAHIPVERAIDLLLEQGFPVEDAAKSSSEVEPRQDPSGSSTPSADVNAKEPPGAETQAPPAASESPPPAEPAEKAEPPANNPPTKAEPPSDNPPPNTPEKSNPPAADQPANAADHANQP